MTGKAVPSGIAVHFHYKGATGQAAILLYFIEGTPHGTSPEDPGIAAYGAVVFWWTLKVRLDSPGDAHLTLTLPGVAPLPEAPGINQAFGHIQFSKGTKKLEPET